MNKPVLGLALVATVLAAVFAPKEESGEVVGAVKQVSRNYNPAQASNRNLANSSEVALNAGQLKVLPREAADDAELTLAGAEATPESTPEAKPEAKDKAPLKGQTKGQIKGQIKPISKAGAAEKAADKAAEKAASLSIWGEKLFASTNWAPPPPPAPIKPVKPPPPPPPSAPPLPFRYMGRWVEDGKTHFFLSIGERNLVVHVGDVLENQYKFESVQAGQLRFTYLPLQQQQILAVGEVN